jgi:hypothetical protein
VRAYYMRLQAAGVEEAEALMEALELVGPVVLQRQESIVLVLWPGLDADDPDEWDEQTYAELIFFLRAWTGHDPSRELIVLEDRPMEVPEEVFRRAS